MTAHWGVDDPAAVDGTPEERERAFNRALRELSARIQLFLNVPLASLDRLSLQQRLDAIGRTTRSEQ
jgi:hypothetical protein